MGVLLVTRQEPMRLTREKGGRRGLPCCPTEEEFHFVIQPLTISFAFSWGHLLRVSTTLKYMLIKKRTRVKRAWHRLWMMPWNIGITNTSSHRYAKEIDGLKERVKMHQKFRSILCGDKKARNPYFFYHLLHLVEHCHLAGVMNAKEE